MHVTTRIDRLVNGVWLASKATIQTHLSIRTKLDWPKLPRFQINDSSTAVHFKLGEEKEGGKQIAERKKARNIYDLILF